MPDEMSAAPEAVEDEAVQPHDITQRGVFVAASAIHAVLPVAMVERCIAAGEVRPTKHDGLWLFEQTSRIDTDNLVMKIRPRGEAYFKTFTPYSRPEEFTNLRLAARELGNVVPFASAYRRLARIIGWPQLLYVWTDEESIFVRRAFTEEAWAALDVRLRRYIVRNRHLFGLPPARG